MIETPAPKPLVRRRSLWITAAVALAVVSTLAFWLLADRALTVTGTVKVTGQGLDWGVHSGQCHGVGGYSDLRPGAQVTVTDASGTVVAIGAIAGEGVPENVDWQPQPISCTFSFTVEGVPAGEAFYGVEVSHRGAVQFTERELGAPLALTVG